VLWWGEQRDRATAFGHFDRLTASYAAQDGAGVLLQGTDSDAFHVRQRSTWRRGGAMLKIASAAEQRSTVAKL
jgi:hypothetical protein